MDIKKKSWILAINLCFLKGLCYYLLAECMVVYSGGPHGRIDGEHRFCTSRSVFRLEYHDEDHHHRSFAFSLRERDAASTYTFSGPTQQ